MTFDIASVVAQAAATSQDMNVSVKGGGNYEPPAAGVCRLRLIGYIEIGKHENRIPNKPAKIEDQVQLVFELSGPKHPAKTLEDGKVIPHRLTITVAKSLNEKANFYKLFKRMNYSGDAKIMAQLLGRSFLGTVVHDVKGEGADRKVYARLKDDAGYTVRPPVVDDPETGETRTIEAAPQISPTRLFLWDMPSKEMWDSLFIDGAYDDGKSKNTIQDKIKSALNWDGSSMWNILRSNGAVPDVPGGEGKPDPLASASGEGNPSTPTPSSTASNTATSATKSPSSGAAADPLAGVA